MTKTLDRDVSKKVSRGVLTRPEVAETQCIQMCRELSRHAKKVSTHYMYVKWYPEVDRNLVYPNVSRTVQTPQKVSTHYVEVSSGEQTFLDTPCVQAVQMCPEVSMELHRNLDTSRHLVSQDNQRHFDVSSGLKKYLEIPDHILRYILTPLDTTGHIRRPLDTSFCMVIFKCCFICFISAFKVLAHAYCIT